jgi:replicative DNA helicase
MGAVIAMDRTPIDQRKLPHNIEAEQMVLGAVLNENDWFVKVGQHLGAGDFYEPIHGLIYDTLASLIESGRVASPVSMKPYVEEIAVGDMNGFQYLMTVWNAAPKRMADAVEYAKIVKNDAINRSLYIILEEELAGILDSRRIEAAMPRIDRLESTLNDLRPPLSISGGFQGFSKAASRAVDIAARAYQRGGVLAGLSTGLQRLDNALGGLHKSDLMTLAGATGMGKSALAINISYAVARGLMERSQEGEKTGVVAFFSLEMPADQIAQRILAEHSRISGWRLRRGIVSESEFGSFSDSASRLGGLPFEIDDTAGLTIAQLAMRARGLNKRRGVELVVVDYLQLLKGSSNRRETNRVQEVAEITAGLKALAKDLNVPVIALSQVSREIAKREDKRPMLSDLRESGSIEMDSDVVLFCYREEYYLKKSEPKPEAEHHADWAAALERAHGRADIIIAKNRHGPEETVQVGFDATLTLFKDELPDDMGPARSRREKPDRPKKLTLTKEATHAWGLLRGLAITNSVKNEGHVDDAPKGQALVEYKLWRNKCVADLKEADSKPDQLKKMMESIRADLLAPKSGHRALIGIGGPDATPYVWLTDAKT